MEINGQPTRLRARFEDVDVGEDQDGKPVKVRLFAPSVTLMERIHADIPFPEAPAVAGQWVKDAKGQRRIDDYGRPVPVRNPTDPTWRAAVVESNILRTVATVVACARGGLAFKAERPQGKDGKPAESAAMVDYYRAVYHEFEEAGLIDTAVWGKLSNAATRLSLGISGDEAKAAAEALGVPADPKS